MTDLTAIDILVEPDATALARAYEENARLRATAGEGFAFDSGHRPHITLLQRYVRTAELDALFIAVERIVHSVNTSQLLLRAVALRHMPVVANPGNGIAAILISPGPVVFELQQSLIAAVEPFTASGGTTAAFETGPQEREINADTLAYVEHYVPDHSGANFVAHITVGLAPLELLEEMEAERFDEFTFRPSAFGVFKLGNNGTARSELKTWQVSY